MPEELVVARQVAEMLDLTRQRVDQLIRTYDDFPKPQVVGNLRIWRRPAIERWIEDHPDRRPGPRGPRTK